VIKAKERSLTPLAKSGTDGENRTTSALHFGNNFPDNRSTGDSTTLTNQANPADNYHVWAVEWGEGLIKWFLDGALYSTKTNDQWFTSAAPDNVNAPFDESFYLILNLAIGGNYPEPLNETGIAESSLPNQLLVDWVRVYQCEEDMETGLACME
jgi:beta-glucanase (GH16 family)